MKPLERHRAASFSSRMPGSQGEKPGQIMLAQLWIIQPFLVLEDSVRKLPHSLSGKKANSRPHKGRTRRS